MHDLRAAARSLTRRRIYVGTGIAILALSLGANLIVFTIVNALWVRPRPVADPDRLVVITSGDSISSGGDTSAWTPAGLARLEESAAFSAVAAQVETSNAGGAFRPRIAFTGLDRPLETIGATWSYFATLGIPVLGRDFTPADDRTGAPAVAIISDRLWKRAFVGRQDILNTIVVATPLPLRVVGIAPPGFRGALLGEQADVWVPAHLVPRLVGAPASQETPLKVLARMTPGVTPLTADRLVSRAMPHGGAGRFRPHIVPLSRVVGGGNGGFILLHEESVLRVVGLTAGLILLGGCLTLATLVLVHYERRRSEFGIRLALGASRGRLGAQLIQSGLIGAMVLARAITSLLIGVMGLDPTTYIGAGLLMVFVAMGAALSGAAGARRLSPADALRAE